MIHDYTFRRCSPETGVKALSSSSFIRSGTARFCSAVVLLLIILTANAGLAGAQNFALKFGTTGSGDGQFKAPQGVAVDSTGNVYVADTDNNRIQKFDSTGNFILKFGSLGTGESQFFPFGVAVDGAGNVYVADFDHRRVQKFGPGGNFILVFGSADTDDGRINAPQGIAVDGAGNIYLSDSRLDRVQKFSPGGVSNSSSALRATASFSLHTV